MGFNSGFKGLKLHFLGSHKNTTLLEMMSSSIVAIYRYFGQISDKLFHLSDQGSRLLCKVSIHLSTQQAASCFIIRDVSDPESCEI